MLESAGRSLRRPSRSAEHDWCRGSRRAGLLSGAMWKSQKLMGRTAFSSVSRFWVLNWSMQARLSPFFTSLLQMVFISSAAAAQREKAIEDARGKFNPFPLCLPSCLIFQLFPPDPSSVFLSERCFDLLRSSLGLAPINCSIKYLDVVLLKNHERNPGISAGRMECCGYSGVFWNVVWRSSGGVMKVQVFGSIYIDLPLQSLPCLPRPGPAWRSVTSWRERWDQTGHLSMLCGNILW